ncbi:MAG TPA: flagellar biosynthesis protein FlhB [Candidatus Scybalomonas excrementigallinarum]|nr:flagellar biosynthesis protein FlhB [Candidatus Scybalomonas excrementigallinarum]
MAGEKTEKATPKKRKDERKKGNIFLSQDIVTVVSLAGIFYLLKAIFPMIYNSMREFLVQMIEGVGGISSLEGVMSKSLVKEIILILSKTALPLILITAVIAILVTGVQTRFLFSSYKIKPKFSNLNPLNGIRKMFAVRNLIELIKNILKFLVIGIVVYQVLKSEIGNSSRTLDMSVIQATGWMLSVVMKVIPKVLLAFVAIAFLDFLYQRWEYERQMKMTKEEIKEEFKMTEGNPEIKGKIKSLQQQKARNRMMQAVPQADVIIRNPTHYAVALQYDVNKSPAPVVVAKGQDAVALRIVEVAKEHGVMVVENKPLARGIYATTKLNQEISPDYYGMVAEILVEVYRVNKKMQL